MSRLSVRWRLVIGATAFAAMAIAAALIAGRWVIAGELLQTNTQLVTADLSAYVAEVREHEPDGDRPAPSTADSLILVRDASGEAIVDTMPPTVATAIDDHDVGGTFQVSGDDQTWLVASTDEGLPRGMSVWAARDVTAISSTLTTVDTLFVVGGALLVALFAIAAGFFVRAALRPIDVMRERERRMVSDAAHELRTPLAGLSAQLGLVRTHLQDPDAAAEEVRRAEHSVARLSDLASNLLELARLDERTEPATASIATIRSAFLSAIDDVRLDPGARDVTMDQSSDVADVSATVAMDGVSFGRLTRNLLSNAVHAAGAGGTVAAMLSVEGRTLRLTVEDDGPGMSEEFRTRALERFSRESTATAPGSGLGLALVDALARSAGGTVTLENTSGGFRASVTIPLR
ncbi:sensor histidine kinase [Microbacterium sp. E-13]|uniref:sensor histidine kinase n=1 Tax=Microbacterium sp. E-13 TaxID=3404048 RepID=UPI003CF14DC5